MREQLYDKEMKEYLKHKYKWTEQIFNTINWTAHETAIKRDILH